MLNEVGFLGDMQFDRLIDLEDFCQKKPKSTYVHLTSLNNAVSIAKNGFDVTKYEPKTPDDRCMNLSHLTNIWDNGIRATGCRMYFEWQGGDVNEYNFKHNQEDNLRTNFSSHNVLIKFNDAHQLRYTIIGCDEPYLIFKGFFVGSHSIPHAPEKTRNPLNGIKNYFSHKQSVKIYLAKINFLKSSLDTSVIVK